MKCECFELKRVKSCPDPVPSNESPECTLRRSEINGDIFFTDLGGQIFFINSTFNFPDAFQLCPDLDSSFHLITVEELNTTDILNTIKEMFTVNGKPCSIVIWSTINGRPTLVRLFSKKCFCVNECLSVCHEVDFEILNTPSTNCLAFSICVAPPA
ncbi:hypothetical protein ACSVDE_02515 [Pseudalkalibacillus sp. Hm43]|uniref:hypothetical protein n=1 Tax=Pseudalkalibacillus sp. Hm43 TaxID=3450742 RepID=UPI003F4408A3